MNASGRQAIVIALTLIVAITAILLIAFAGAASYNSLNDDPQAIVSQPSSEPNQRRDRPRLSGDVAVAPDTAGQLGRIDPDDRPLGREELRRLRNAALTIAGGGALTEVDRSDDLGEAYEVEVVTDGGGEIDIALDRNFERVPNLRYDD